MKGRLTCVISAAISVLLIVCTVNYAFNTGKEEKKSNMPVLEASQKEVVVQDFIHDNYVISEKNPWTDYSLHPVEYSHAESTVLDVKISAGAAILVDIKSNAVLYGKNADKRMFPASTTKLMTALTVLQIMSVNDVVTIGDEVSFIASDSSKAGFSKGQIVTVEELLEGLLISSGNDSAYILARAAGQAIFEDNIANEGKTFTAQQCVQRFILEMNRNVSDMELENTHFTSPDGYDDNNQYTTASDLSKIAIEAYSNEVISDICKKSSVKSGTLGKTWTSTNALLDKDGEHYYKYCKGLKTGSTGLAGKCLVSVGKKENKECVSVILNDTTDEQRWNDSKKLLSFGLE